MKSNLDVKKQLNQFDVMEVSGYADVIKLLSDSEIVRVPNVKTLKRLLSYLKTPNSAILSLIESAPFLEMGDAHLEKRRRAQHLSNTLTKYWSVEQIAILFESTFSCLANEDVIDCQDFSWRVVASMVAETLSITYEQIKTIALSVNSVISSIPRNNLRLKDYEELAKQMDEISHLAAQIKIGRCASTMQEELAFTALATVIEPINLISNAVTYSLLELEKQPEIKKRLLEKPNLRGAFVHEVYRCFGGLEGPVPMRTKRSYETAEGQVIDAGTTFHCSIASANKDPSHFENSKAFDLDRNVKSNISFGYGVHRCVGQRFSFNVIEGLLKAYLGKYKLQQCGLVISEVQLVGRRFMDVPVMFERLDV